MDHIMTVSEAARQLRQSVYTIRNWIKSGKLEASKIGRSYLISEEAIRAIIARPSVPKQSLGIKKCLKTMRELQAETIKSGVVAPCRSIFDGLESRDQESRDEMRRLLGGSSS